MLRFFDADPECVQFTATVELMGHNLYHGKRGNADVLGMQWVLVTECQPDGRPEELALSSKSQSEWKDLSFFAAWVEELDEKVDIADMGVALQYVQPDSTLRLSITDPRLQIGWFQKASDLLVDAVKGDGAEKMGPVMQLQMTPNSTMLKVNSSSGWYFAKSPAWGWNECSVTAEIARIFPESSPKVPTKH